MRLRISILALAILLLTSSLATASDIPVDEASLTEGGLAYEIKRDAAGRLYVTDWGIGQIWRVDPATGAYSRFSGVGAPNDGTPDSAGNIWLTDYNNPYLRRINTAANLVTMTSWDLSAWDSGRTFSLAGLAFDDGGKLWFSEWDTPATQLLYRFDPTTNDLCGYLLPDGNHSYYVLYQNPYIWLGDSTEGRIVRFNPATLAVDYWDATYIDSPRGLAADAGGNIWWADSVSGDLARLQVPDSIRLYTPPVSADAYMLAAEGDKIRYTAQGATAGYAGILEPALAGYTPKSKSPASATATVVRCANMGSGNPSSVTSASGTLTWASNVWAVVTPAGSTGWTVYQAGTEFSSPYGILAQADRVWVTDQWRQKLVRITLGLATPQVTIQIPGGTTNVQLSWSPVTGAGTYRVWLSEQPYFNPDATMPQPDIAVTTFTHSGVAADAAHNYYYVVRSVAGTNISPDSNRTGEFTFSLTPGAG